MLFPLRTNLLITHYEKIILIVMLLLHNIFIV
jgi:hypothetical protein